MNWAGILETLKDINGTRFYFIVTLIFFLIVGQVFKDEISVAIKEVTFDKVEFRDARDLKGLEVAMSKLVDDNIVVKDYTVYLYQPKDKSYFKRMMITNSDLVKSSSILRSSYLEDQSTINKAIANKDYILLTEDMDATDTRLLRDLGLHNLLVYKIFYRATIGEIFITFTRPPTTKELDKVLRELSPLVHIYII